MPTKRMASKMGTEIPSNAWIGRVQQVEVIYRTDSNLKYKYAVNLAGK
jgi:hypothetical protein